MAKPKLELRSTGQTETKTKLKLNPNWDRTQTLTKRKIDFQPKLLLCTYTETKPKLRTNQTVTEPTLWLSANLKFSKLRLNPNVYQAQPETKPKLSLSPNQSSAQIYRNPNWHYTQMVTTLKLALNPQTKPKLGLTPTLGYTSHIPWWFSSGCRFGCALKLAAYKDFLQILGNYHWCQWPEWWQ